MARIPRGVGFLLAEIADFVPSSGVKPTLVFILAAGFLAVVHSAEERRNLLFIYLDDFGWRDTSFMGSDFYETPHLDELAGQGMVFTQAYSPAANCAPARASLLTGQYSPRHEIYNVGTGPRGKSAHRRLEHIPGRDTLRPDAVTWSGVLADAGYRTALMGKWHLSQDPLDHGFTLNIGGSHSGSPPKGYYPPHPRVPGLGEVAEGEYLTDTLSRAAAAYVRENAGRPWVLYLSHFAVHTPLDAKRELVAKYEAKSPGERHDHVAMATMIQSVDDGVAEIMSALEETGQADRTVIVFFSDNGGYGPATDMDPLKGYKGTYYEGGIRVPLFVVWPGRVAPDQTSEIPVHGVDLFPTFCDLLGVDLPATHALDGRSLVPVLEGSLDETTLTEWRERALFWHFPAYLQSYGGMKGELEQRDPLFRSRPVSLIRRGKWKLHQYFEDEALELYDLETDPGESTNLAESRQAIAEDLLAELRAWQEATKAAIPAAPNPEFDAGIEARAIEKAVR